MNRLSNLTHLFTELDPAVRVQLVVWKAFSVERVLFVEQEAQQLLAFREVLVQTQVEVLVLARVLCLLMQFLAILCQFEDS